MRTILPTIAKLALLGAFFAFGTAELTTPTDAGEHGYSKTCHKKYCPGVRHILSDSVGLFPSRCNGELGFWLPVTFANGEVLCIAQSTADFYHNGSLVPTCTKKTYDRELHKLVFTTTDGACPPKMSKHYQ